jgi:hypothetical protein
VRERFTSAEWEAVKRLPFVAFGMVAGADGTLQREEAERFVEELRATAFCREPLRRLLTQDILASDFMRLFGCSIEKERWEGWSDAGLRALRSRLGPEEVRSFLGGLVVFAVGVALAAGRRGEGKKSPEEDAALIGLAERFGLDIEDLRREVEHPPC